MEILENKEEWSRAFKAGWLAHLEKTGEINWRLYKHPTNQQTPGTPGIVVEHSRLMFISSAGAYLRDRQKPFAAANTLGDYTMRVIPSDVNFDDLAYAHDHYDHTMVNQDPQVALPLGILRKMVHEGSIADLAPSMISFTGYQPDSVRFIEELLPQIVEQAQKEDIQAALLAPV
jgi:D-proline reductase (dithiol) PrdB